MSSPGEYEAVVAEMRELVEKQVKPCYRWYDGHKGWPRLLFRAGGLIVVVGSLLLPAIAAQNTPPFRQLLTAVSLSVAIMSSLNSFFRWDATWRSRTRAAYALQGMLGLWEFELRAAAAAGDPACAAREATGKLMRDAFALVGSETDEFFATVRWPEAPTRQS